MITIPTVLIFGAGVSAPFNYPLGIGLRNNILQNLDGSGSEFFQELIEIGYSEDQIRDFRAAFNYSGKESVDAFLEHRTDYLEVGKAAIAQELTRYESDATLFASEGEKLYFYLFRHLNALPADFKRNKLSVVTFNYDRSLEHFLFTSLKNLYNLSDEETATLVQWVPIIHVHGHLGLLPWQGNDGRPYGAGNRLDDIRIGAKNIRVIHEQVDIDKEPEFQKAHRRILDAQRIIFLGCGYDKTNIDRLRIPTNSKAVAIFGSGFGVTEREKVDIISKLIPGKTVIGHRQDNALTFLRETLSLS